MNQKTLDYFAGKTVCLVGNSVEIMNHDCRDFIDSHDIVVRFGRGVDFTEEQKTAVGTRTDVWVTGFFRAAMIDSKSHGGRRVRDCDMILFNRNRLNLNTKHTVHEEVQKRGFVNMWSDEELREIIESFGIVPNKVDSTRLSAGLLTIMFFCEKICNYKELNIVGFDFFRKNTNQRRGGTFDPSSWHQPIGIGEEGECHNHDVEVSVINTYIEQGILNWKILTNLDPEVLNETKHGFLNNSNKKKT